MHCEKCHIPVKPYFSFCPNCGARLHTGIRNIKMLVLFIILLIVLGSALMAVFFLNPGGRTGPTASSVPLFDNVPKSSGKSLDFFARLGSPTGQNSPDVRVSVGRVIFYDIAGAAIGEIPAAASESGWIPIPVRRCIGAERWVFRSASGEDHEIFGGIIGDYDDIGLWQFRAGPMSTPPLFPADTDRAMTWVSLDSEYRAELAGISVIVEQQNVDRILLTGFPEGPGVFIQDKKIVGWTFSGFPDGYVWKGLDEENRVVEVGVADFYRLTFAGSREEQFIIAYAETDGSPKDQLAAFAKGFYQDPMLFADNTPARLTSSAAVTKMRAITALLLDQGDLSAIVSILDGRVLSAAGDAAFVTDVAAFNDQVGGPESAVGLIEAVLERPENFDQAQIAKISAMQKQLYRKWLNREIHAENAAEGRAVYQRAAAVFEDDPEIHLIGARLALASSDWAAAEAILRGHAFPMELADQVRILEDQIAQWKSGTEKIVIRFSPGSGLIPVTGRINNRITLNFIVDTGASMVTIPSAAAAKLGIRTDGAAPMENLVTAGGVVPARRVNLESITVGEWTEYNIPAYVLDLPEQSGMGLLGLNYLNRFRMDLNTRSGILTLAPR